MNDYHARIDELVAVGPYLCVSAATGQPYMSTPVSAATAREAKTAVDTLLAMGVTCRLFIGGTDDGEINIEWHAGEGERYYGSLTVPSDPTECVWWHVLDRED